VAPPLNGKQRRHLRALAHHLAPVLRIGVGGLTPAVLAEMNRSLEAHELIKVRVEKECPTAAKELSEPIERGAHAAVAQVIGRTLVLYRRRAKNPKIELPRAGREK
jgi:RNA-binding protein